MTAGPTRNRTAIANAASLFPQAMIRGCSAMNKPEKCDSLVLAAIHDTATEALSNAVSEIYRPRLNMAMPRPASDRIEIDRAMIAGISIPHLNT
jgi:hypothetical protein